MSFDNLCKLLSEKYPDRFNAWLLGEEPRSVEVLKTELGIEPIRADSVTFLQTTHRILHLEFQTELKSNPPLPVRMLDYWIRLHRLYRLPVTQVVVLLLPPPIGTPIETVFELETTRHEYRVVKMWEQDAEFFLQDPVLLPFAPLAATQNPDQLLDRAAQQINQIQPTQRRQEVSTYLQVLAGLKYNKDSIRRIFREGMMRESVIYQEILQEGIQEGQQKGRQEGRQEMILKMLQEGVEIELIARVTGLSIEQIQALSSQANLDSEPTDAVD